MYKSMVATQLDLILKRNAYKKQSVNKNWPVCDGVEEPVEENNEDLSVEKEIEWRLGDTGLDLLVGDTDAETLGGEPGGVIRGVLLCDAKRRLCDTLGLPPAILQFSKKKIYYVTIIRA